MFANNIKQRFSKMNWHKKLLVIFGISGLFLLSLFFLKPQDSFAKHICGKWGITNGDPTYPAGLVVETKDEAGNAIYPKCHQ